MDLIYIANTADHIDAADAAGVDRVMVDLEINGKIKRQGHLNTVISQHVMSDVGFARQRLKNAQLMVRINPVFEGTQDEIDRAISLGADIVMLPMFKTVAEVETFGAAINGRARTSLLLETAEALGRADQILTVPGIDEVHVGLNDLHLALGLTFMFELLSGGLVEHLAGLCQKHGLKYGFGGIARIGTGLLPASQIMAEHARLGSSQVILSRDFHALFETNDPRSVADRFSDEVARLRESFVQAGRTTSDETMDNIRNVRANVDLIVSKIEASRT